MSEAPRGAAGDVSIARAHAGTKGAIAWMARNPVAANLLMIVIMLGGILTAARIKKEVFPQFDLDVVTVAIPYPGASPAEVESGVLLSVEEAVRGVDGVKRVTSTANENLGTVSIELLLGTDTDEALSDIRGEIDRITSFPENAEEPTVSLLDNRMEAISVVIYGELTQHELHDLAEHLRTGLLDSPDITVAEVEGIPPLEMSIEVPREALSSYGLTHQEIAQIVGAASLELPAGSVETEGGDRLLRVQRQLDRPEQFEEIAVVSRPDGTEVLLGEIAEVHDTFEDNNQAATFNGLPAARIVVYRVGDETPVSVSEAVKAFIDEAEPTLPEGVSIALWNDSSEMYRGRVDLLQRNAQLGLILVLLLLSFFLEVRLAFWVTMGIPISFLGAMLLAPVWGVSINMISLFAFILTLGIVVDDAVVVGEAVFKYRQLGYSPGKAALMGTREVATPVVFSVTTTIIAFLPLFFVPGAMGKFMGVIPAMVVTILALSLFESLFILPAHLSHVRERGGAIGAIDRVQRRFAGVVDRVIDATYRPLVRRATRFRYATVALAVATLLATIGFVKSGGMPFSFMPSVDSEVITADVILPASASVEETRAVQDHIVAEARATCELYADGDDEPCRGIYATIGSASVGGGPGGSRTNSGSNIAQVLLYLVDAGDRGFETAEFADAWRGRVGDVAGLELLTFNFDAGPSAAGAIDIELRHEDIVVLEEAATELARVLSEYGGVREIDDGFSAGKEQLNVRLRPEARALGLTEASLASQVRAAFYGVEVTRQQRGRQELKIFVRLPEHERASEYDIESLMIRTPLGGELPLDEAAIIERGTSYTTITRVDGRRAVNVTADVDLSQVTGNEVIRSLRSGPLPELLSQYSGLGYDLAGEQREQAETIAALATSGVMALFAIFALMAISFKSYAQPLVVMIAIPFGVVGAVAGHVIMGYGFSMISALGVTALAGVVVNDSLVLVTAVNDFRAGGLTTQRAAVEAGVRRFRPIILTSTTTFLGLMPMILETSAQARFLIPMAISLGFGVLFTTYVILFLVPALYVIVDDVSWLMGHTPLFERRPYGVHVLKADET